MRAVKDRTTAYAKLVCSGKKIVGHSEYLACKRHLDDMENEDFPYIFDVKEAEKHLNIANELTIGEGNSPKRLKTRGFQNFIIGSLFGWRKKRSNKRRYREAYIQVGRQNSKSFLAGALANDFSTFCGYKYGRVLCTATKRDQAKIVWKELAKFIKSDTDLKALYKVQEYKYLITSLVTGTTIEAVGRDTNSMDGFRSILSIVDEYHAHKTNQMYKLTLDGQINVDSALTIAITTAGFNLNGACYSQYIFSKNVLKGVIRKESLFVYITELDPEDVEGEAIWNSNNWAKANPLLLWKDDTTLNEEMIARMAEKGIDAKYKGGDDLMNFLTKSLNYWVTCGGGAFSDAEHWRNCGTARTIADMDGRKCYLGFDLSSGGDLTSIALIFPPIRPGEKSYVWSHSYMPKLRLAEHERTDQAPYRIWVNMGLITLTDSAETCGIKTDYKYIIRDLKEIISQYHIAIAGCGYDPANAAAFLSDLGEVLDCDLTEVRQSARSLNDATKDLQLTIKAEQIEYDKKNELLTWSVVNAVTTSNSFDEIKIDKKSVIERIDPVDAIIDAWKLLWESQNQSMSNDEANDLMAKIFYEGGDED